MSEKRQKPSCDEWLSWAQVVVDRLSNCVHVYSKPPTYGGFMPDKERQDKNARNLALLRRIYNLIDSADGVDGVSDEGALITELQDMFEETLAALPGLSTDMQHLLKSPWYEDCNGEIATVIFCGTDGAKMEGIGSGHAEHGRLPRALKNLISREQMGDSRAPSRSQRQGTAQPVATIVEPSINPVERSKTLQQQWATQNSRHLRSAGRMD